MRRTVYVVDDVPTNIELVEAVFRSDEDIVIKKACDGSELLDGIHKDGLPDLIILDLMMPVMDGFDVLKKLKDVRAKSYFPIIVLSALTDKQSIINALSLGADDYVTKPFRFAVLLARIRAQLRSHEQSEDAVFKIGPYEFRPAVKMLVNENDRKIRLTEKEASILKFLYRAGGKPVTRDVLLDEVWGYNSGVTTHTLETHVYRLRQKIEPNPSQATILLTEAGGYRLAL